MRVLVLLQEFHHGDVVVQAGRGGYDFVEIGRVGRQLLQRLIKLLRGPEVMKGQHHSGLGTQPIDLRRF